MIPRGGPDRPAARRIGVNTWQPWIGPHRLMLRTQFQSSIDIAPIGVPPAPTPALLITRVGGPSNQSWAVPASAVTSSSRETSQCAAVARPPRSMMASATRWAAGWSMSLHTTAPPRAPSSVANAAPMPLPAPVTTA